MAFMFMKGVTMFYVMRFLLGAAEAGFSPGIILYLTYWYPAKERARTIALFALGGVWAVAIGSPISGAILGLNAVGGLAARQWLFFLEALPAVLIGLFVLFILPNGPQPARWLSDRERAWIQVRLSEEDTRADSSQRHRLRDVFTSGRVWLVLTAHSQFVTRRGAHCYESRC